MTATYWSPQMDYSQDREREDASTFESQPFNSFAAADQETHWLFRNKFTAYCSCSRCEAEMESIYADAAMKAEWLDEMAAKPFPLFAMFAAEMDGARYVAGQENLLRSTPPADPWSF